MKRMRIVGLCLLALFAVSALTASSAFAEPPEYQICGKAAKVGKTYTGKYSTKTCGPSEATAKEQEEGKKNKYEREEYSKAKKKTYKGKNVGTPKNFIVNPLDTPAKDEGVTECTTEKVTGEVTGAKTQKWHTEYSHCIGNGVPCNTTGAKAGVIKTEQLESTLVWLNSGKSEPGLRVKGNGPGGLLAQYECPSLKLNITVYGEVLVKTSGNTNEAQKKAKAIVAGGPDGLQSNLYENGTETEETGKGYFEWGFAFEACVTEEVGKGHSVAEAEAICFGKLGPFPGYPNKPVSLVSVVTKNSEPYAKAPAVQNGTTESTGEAFLIATT